MIKFFRATILVLLALVCGQTLATTVVFDPAVDFGSQAGSSTGEDQVTKDGITISASPTGSFGNGVQYRVYKSSTFTISSTIGNITSVAFTCTAKDNAKYGPGCFTGCATGSYTYSGNDGNWTGDASQISWTASSNQVRMTSISVVVGAATPNQLTIMGDTPFSDSTKVTIIPSNPDYTVYYTTDGWKPYYSSYLRKKYTAPFTISNTTRVQACEVDNNGNWSEMVVKVFKKEKKNKNKTTRTIVFVPSENLGSRTGDNYGEDEVIVQDISISGSKCSFGNGQFYQLVDRSDFVVQSVNKKLISSITINYIPNKYSYIYWPDEELYENSIRQIQFDEYIRGDNYVTWKGDNNKVTWETSDTLIISSVIVEIEDKDEFYTELKDSTLTFYYDKERLNRSGDTYGPVPGWRALQFDPYMPPEYDWYIPWPFSCVNKVVFDSSFADYYPDNTCLWFSEMKNLRTIEGVEHLNWDSVHYATSMFKGCEKLKTLDSSFLRFKNVIHVENMFYGCSGLSSLDLSVCDFSKVDWFFIDGPGGDSVDEIIYYCENFLTGCKNINTLRIPKSWNSDHFYPSCKDIGTEESPCLLYLPEGLEPNKYYFYGGHFRFPNENDLSIVGDVSTLTRGTECDLNVYLNPILKVCNGYQFVLNLPAGITLAEDENSGDYFYSLGERYSDKDKIQIAINEKGPGVYQLLCFSLTNETINIRDIPVITLKLVVPENLVDNIYEGKITDVACSFVDGSSLNADDTFFTIPVSRIKMGDANGDGSVNVTDVMLIVNHILGNTLPVFHEECANINGDSRIDVADVMLVVNMILSGEAQAPAIAQFETSGLDAVSTSGNKVELRMDNMSQYTAFQMEVQMPADVRLLGVEMAEETTGHRVMTKEIGDGLYNVIVYSLNGENFKETSDDTLLRLVASGKAKNLQIQNIQFTNPSFETITFSDVTGTTGIEDVSSDETDGIYYNLQGMPVKTPTHGVFINKGKKVVIK